MTAYRGIGTYIAAFIIGEPGWPPWAVAGALKWSLILPVVRPGLFVVVVPPFVYLAPQYDPSGLPPTGCGFPEPSPVPTWPLSARIM